LDLLVHLDDVGAGLGGRVGGVARNGVGLCLAGAVLLADDAVTLDFLVDLDGHRFRSCSVVRVLERPHPSPLPQAGEGGMRAATSFALRSCGRRLFWLAPCGRRPSSALPSSERSSWRSPSSPTPFWRPACGLLPSCRR